MPLNILLTGATGFVGRALLHELGRSTDNNVVALARRSIEDAPLNSKIIISDDFSIPESNLNDCRDIHVVVHCGARAHHMDDNPETCLKEYRLVNVEATLKLAKQAAAAGVKRFVYISSIKVNGEKTRENTQFTAEDEPAPVDPYGVSKMEAEDQLKKIASIGQMELVIIRPVLVYGPGVKANFLSLINLVGKRVPLPFGKVDNKRSFVYIGNLIEFIKVCMVHPAAADNIFVISDGEDLSTPDLILKISEGFGRKAILLPIPVRVMTFFAGVLGRRAVADRLFSSLQVDVRKNVEVLGWRAPYSVDRGIECTVEAFKEKNKA